MQGIRSHEVVVMVVILLLLITEALLISLSRLSSRLIVSFYMVAQLCKPRQELPVGHTDRD